MNGIIYRPGDWQVIIEDSGVVAVPSDASPERISALIRMLQSGTPALTEVIDALSGGSIAALASFAIALDGADGTRFAVRGATVTVRVAGDDGTSSFSGADVSTWSERFVTGIRGFELSLGASASDTAYPLRAGVVLASSVRAGDVDSAADVRDASAPLERADSAPEAEAEDEGAAEEADEEAAADEPVPAAPVDDAPVLHTLVPTDLTYAPEEDAGLDATIASVPAAAVPAPLPPVPSPPLPGVADPGGDHDGATISLAEARRLRAAAPAAPDAPTEVLPVQDAPHTASAGRIRLSTGQVIELDRTVIIGRRPRSTRASGDTLPHLVAVDSPQQDISRNHLEIRPEGDSVVVIDLHTTNGSTLLRPGADPVRLHPGEQTLVLGGDTIDLGDGVTVGFEGLA